MLAYMRIESEDPVDTNDKILILEPNRLPDRIESELPSCRKFKMLAELAAVDFADETSDTADPSRTTARRLSAEPRLAKLSTDTAEPHRACERRLTELPKLAKPITLMVETEPTW
jgi:hypothetical protein